jgi:hypothetical protein
LSTESPAAESPASAIGTGFQVPGFCRPRSESSSTGFGVVFRLFGMNRLERNFAACRKRARCWWTSLLSTLPVSGGKADRMWWLMLAFAAITILGILVILGGTKAGLLIYALF